MVFNVFQKLLLPLFASFKLLTPQNSLLSDWSVFSIADLSLAAGKCARINLSQAVSGMIYKSGGFLKAILVSKSPL
jgi:hypothetical protein